MAVGIIGQPDFQTSRSLACTLSKVCSYCKSTMSLYSVYFGKLLISIYDSYLWVFV